MPAGIGSVVKTADGDTANVLGDTNARHRIHLSKTMTNLTLLGLERSVYTRIARLALEEKSADYILEEVDIFVDGGPPKDYLKHNPFGKIPCLIHEDYCLYETGAITRYVDEFFTGSSLQPKELGSRARMNQIISVLDSYAYHPMVWEVFVQRIVVPEECGLPDEGIISSALQPIKIVLDQLDKWLGGREYLAGHSISLADIHCFPMLQYFAQTPEGLSLLDSYPSLTEWLSCMRARPSVMATKSRYG